MNKYKISCDRKVYVNGPSEASSYILSPVRKNIRAKSFTEARNKARKIFNYDVINITVEQLKDSWITRLFKKNKRS